MKNHGPTTATDAGAGAMAYYNIALNALTCLQTTQLEPIVAAARICTDVILKQGLVFLFGSGHSRMMADEMTPRQGCFVGFYPLVELSTANYSAIIGPNGLRTPLYLEKYEGYAEEILRSFHFGPHDAFIVISTSGIRPLVVEMALGAKARKLPVIAILSRAHCEASQPTHSSGKKLLDVADIVIDNMCPVGDCAVEMDGLAWRTGPLSTVTGAMIINMLRCETARMLLEHGHHPVMLPSHQFLANETAEEQLEIFYEEYRKSLRHLFE